METTTYSDRLKEIMGLIVEQSPNKPRILEKSRDLKIQLTRDFTEIQRLISLLDGIVVQYAPDKDWQMGFWSPDRMPSNIIFRSTGPLPAQPVRRVTVANPEHTLELANNLAKGGIVDTNEIIARLKLDGDHRPDRALAISIGNVLNNNKWERIDTGKYRMPGGNKDQTKLMSEVK